MILVFLLLLSACAACHTCEDPAFERITSTTIIEKKEVGFSGLLVILENSVRNLAEKQANMTSGMNHSYFNLADSAVGNDAYNHDEEIFLADSRNESNLSNCSLSLQSTPPDTKNYHLYLNTLTPVSPTVYRGDGIKARGLNQDETSALLQAFAAFVVSTGCRADARNLCRALRQFQSRTDLP